MIDCHIHYASSLGDENFSVLTEEYGIERMVLLCIPEGNGRSVNEDALDYRTRARIPVYVLGSLPREIYGLPEQEMSLRLKMEAKRLAVMGCSGIKMLEGKPNVRKAFPIPDFDRDVWEPFWEEAETKQIPILFHVNDPKEFWDPDKVTDAARRFGWFYDQTYVTNEAQYGQVLRVLERHPRLRILFPHLFFMSGQLERLGGILDRYENVMTDLTPGIELYYNLSSMHEEAVRFFRHYQDRICYGTDIGARQVILEQAAPLCLEESRARIRLVTDFLERGGNYCLEPDGYYQKGAPVILHGLGLPEEIRDKIYRDNILVFLKQPE